MSPLSESQYGSDFKGFGLVLPFAVRLFPQHGMLKLSFNSLQNRIMVSLTLPSLTLGNMGDFLLSAHKRVYPKGTSIIISGREK
jgi:hypothetical protein